jgi:hypothetical protein
VPPPPDPVTAADVDAVVAAAVAALRPAAAADWSVRAGDLTWTCWETVEHLADDLFVYGAQLAPVAPDRGLPFEADARGPAGPRNTIRARPDAGVDGLLDVLAAGGAVLAAMARAAPPGREGFHVFGPADAEASAAMGVLETLVHVHDVATGLGATWTPDADLCARVLARLMPDVEPAADPWTTLQWATGRTDLPGRARRTSWRWTNAPGAEAVPMPDVR